MNVLITLPLGIIAQLLLFFVLRQAVHLQAKAAALIIALAALALYIPYSILVWPGADVLAMHVAVYLVTAYALGLIFGYRETRLDDVRGFHWGPTLIVSFFVVLILFNSILVVVATQGLPESVARALFPKPAHQGDVTSVFPGVVQNDMQQKEALYNAYLEQVRRQDARGWRVRMGWLSPAHVGKPANFQVAVDDREGNPVTGAKVRGEFLRDADTRFDQKFTLLETAPGLYQGESVLALPGAWSLILEIRRGEDLHEVRATTGVAE